MATGSSCEMSKFTEGQGHTCLAEKMNLKIVKRIILPLSALGTGIGLTVLLKDQTMGTHKVTEEKLHGKTVVITGTTSGLGKETALELAKRGGRIIMGCRDLTKCQKVQEEIIEESFNKNVHCHKLDMASMASIRAFAEEINKKEKKVHILINNAGEMGLPKKQVTEDGFEYQLGVNYLGPFLLTTLLLDKLKTSQPSRILNITCIAFKKAKLNFADFNSDQTYDAREAYGQSKLALFYFTKQLEERLRGTRVTVYNIHPGICYTDIGRHMGMNKSYLSSAILGPVWWLLLKTPKQGIQTTVHCALEPYEAYFTGQYYEECMVNEGVSRHIYNVADAERLWAISERWTRSR